MGRFELLVIADQGRVEGRRERARSIPENRPTLSAAVQIDEAVIWAEARQVSVTGELDLASAAALQSVLAGTVDSGLCCIVLDLSGCDFLDAGALGVIVRMQLLLAANGQELVIDGASGQVERLIGLAQATSPQVRVGASRYSKPSP